MELEGAEVVGVTEPESVELGLGLEAMELGMELGAWKPRNQGVSINRDGTEGTRIGGSGNGTGTGS